MKSYFMNLARDIARFLTKMILKFYLYIGFIVISAEFGKSLCTLVFIFFGADGIYPLSIEGKQVVCDIIYLPIMLLAIWSIEIMSKKIRDRIFDKDDDREAKSELV